MRVLKLERRYKDNSKISEKNDYRMVVDYGCEGFGRIITYTIFEGITIVFLYFDTEEIFNSKDYDTDIISISYCYKGRYECEFKNHQNTQLPMGYFSVNGTEYLPSYFRFPLKVYEGISIVIEKNKLSKNMMDILEVFKINLEKIDDVLKDNKIWFVRKVNKELEHIFSELYIAENSENLGYFRIKTVELLHEINSIIKKQNKGLIYYKNSELNEVKRICEEMKVGIDNKGVIADIVKNSGISLRKFYDIFVQIYGTTPYAYLKKYKMNVAANYLVNTDNKIIDIALSLGYSKPGKFTEAFKSIYEETPNEYRKKRKQEWDI
ncbi:TPA: helix-turn-helix transcriptional regulator [Enterococcus faecalis]|nr:helix-turn-helix transcriptional regulator [Enterococcus faecalis]HBI3892937.1 helix-turn-helix transcriptional regulator [Enterococcus faecium]